MAIMLTRGQSLTIAALALASMTHARDARAQTSLDPVRVEAPSEPTAPRFRFGVGTHGGYGKFGAGFLLAGYLRAGVQISDLFAIEAQGSGAMLVTMYYFRANLYADFTLNSWASVSVGPVWSQGALGESSGSMTGASARVSALPWAHRHPNGVRSALSISLEADGGASLSERCYCPPGSQPRPGQFSWGLYGSVGYLRF